MPSAQAYRAAQVNLIAQGDTAGAIYMDIQDVHGLFGSKYDEAIYQMLESMK
jgi:hypothetical protein